MTKVVSLTSYGASKPENRPNIRPGRRDQLQGHGALPKGRGLESGHWGLGVEGWIYHQATFTPTAASRTRQKLGSKFAKIAIFDNSLGLGLLVLSRNSVPKGKKCPTIVSLSVSRVWPAGFVPKVCPEWYFGVPISSRECPNSFCLSDTCVLNSPSHCPKFASQFGSVHVTINPQMYVPLL